MTGGELGHDAGHGAGGSLAAGFVHPGGVDLEGGGAAAAVAEAAGDGAMSTPAAISSVAE